MKNTNNQMRLSAMALAIAAVVLSMSARADEDEAAALKMPKNTVELGVANTDQASGKFGEYNGMSKKGASAVGNFRVQGGDAFSPTVSNGVTRWSLTGSDLGLNSRSLSGAYAEQGGWNIGISYDELRHNLSDSYQTPYQGTVGGNTFVLPAGTFPIAAPGTVTASAPQLGPNALAPGLFQNMDIYSGRKNTRLNAGFAIDSRTSLFFDFNHLVQSGAKLQGFGQSFTAAVAPSTAAITGEAVAILPMPTSSKTDTMALGLNWVGDKAHFTTSFNSSFYRDDYDRVNFQTYMGVSGAQATQAMTTPPSNSFHQFNLSGGYELGAKTKLVGNYSKGRNTQDEAFVPADAGIMVTPAPRTSLAGSVVTTHADLRLTNQDLRNLNLSALVRSDERDNRTPSSIYNFNAIGSGNIANYPNTPLSNSKHLFELAGDYTLKRDHHVRVSYARENISRWCNDYAVNAGYPAGTACVVAGASKEDKLELAYRVHAGEGTELRFSLGQNDRKTDSNPYAIAAFRGQNGAVPGPIPATNTTPAGQNAGDYYGFYPFFDATRKQSLAKVSANFDVSEAFSLMVGARYGRDQYSDSTYGVQGGNTFGLNLDGTYAYSSRGTVSAYATQQQRQRSMTNLQRNNATASAASANGIGVPATASWTNDLSDKDLTLGFNVKHGGLLGGKLELMADASRSVGTASYSTALNYANSNPAAIAPATVAASCDNAAILSCGTLPEIRSVTTTIKLTGTYALDPKSRVILRLMHQKLAATDYYYNGYQLGSNPNSLLPDNQNSGSYSVNAVALTYSLDF